MSGGISWIWYLVRLCLWHCLPVLGWLHIFTVQTMVSRTASPLQLRHCFEGNLVRGSKPVLVSKKQRKYYHILDLDLGNTDCFGGGREVGVRGQGQVLFQLFVKTSVTYHISDLTSHRQKSSNIIYCRILQRNTFVSFFSIPHQ